MIGYMASKDKQTRFKAEVMCAQITSSLRDLLNCMTPHIRTGRCCLTWGTTRRSVTVEKDALELRSVIYWKRAMVEVNVANDSTEEEEARKYRLQLPIMI